MVEGSPFAFPPQNQFQKLTTGSAFYRYTPGVDGRAPAWPESLDPTEALFSETCTPTTGHPAGLTFGWVANDRENLYAAVEFTPDNTRDGDADWAGIQVVTGESIREFRVSEEKTRWGLSRFGPTARAGYRHKLYTFAIPFSELGFRTPAEAGELKLAFSAYGTAAISWLSPLFHDFGTIQVGSTSPAATFTILNTTQQSMVLGTPWYTHAGPNSAVFPVTPGTCSDGLVDPARKRLQLRGRVRPGVHRGEPSTTSSCRPPSGRRRRSRRPFGYRATGCSRRSRPSGCSAASSSRSSSAGPGSTFCAAGSGPGTR